MSSTSTLRSGRHGSMGSMESSREPFSKSPRSTKKTMEDIPEGPSKLTQPGPSQVCTFRLDWLHVMKCIINVLFAGVSVNMTY